MNEAIPQVLSYNEPVLDAAFGRLAEEVRSEALTLIAPDTHEAGLHRFGGWSLQKYVDAV